MKKTQKEVFRMKGKALKWTSQTRKEPVENHPKIRALENAKKVKFW